MDRPLISALLREALILEMLFWEALVCARAPSADAPARAEAPPGVVGQPMREAHHWPASALVSVIATCVSGTSNPNRVIPIASSVDSAATW